MLDSNLLTFFIADATDGTKHHATFFQTRSDSEPEPAYTIQHPDPSSPTSRNCYAAALFDPYAADVNFGDVLINPKWTRPTLNQDEIRRNGGVPPPPEPIMPTEFTIQLYNPDLQIHVTYRASQIFGTARWEFSMPQDTFRTPSTSMLDKSQNDPGAAVTTPRINFVWKKESKFTKEMTCFVTGKSTDVQSKKKHKEPDIAVAQFKGLREITVFEPNLYRVDMEDPKGLEVTLLLSAAVIKDVFFGNIKQVFNVSGARLGGGPVPSGAAAVSRSSTSTAVNGRGPEAGAPYGRPHSQSLTGGLQPPPNPGINRVQTTPEPPITDARTQWELDAETARLKAHFESEERDRRRQEEARRKERDRADAEETKRLRKIFDQEQRGLIAEQKKVEMETERLRRIHGQQAAQQQPVPGQHAAMMSSALAFSPHPSQSQPVQPFHPDSYGYHPPQPHPPAMQGLYAAPPQHNYAGPYQQSSGGHVSSNSLGAPSSNSLGAPSGAPRRRSHFNLRSLLSDADSRKLSTKSSSVR